MSATEEHQDAPSIDYENLPAPTEGILVTQYIAVRSVARSRAFYSEILGGQVVLEENPCIVKLANSWVLMDSGRSPHPRQARRLPRELRVWEYGLELYEPARRRYRGVL